MISTSDLVILVVASGALAVGVYRWHENTQDVNAITIPASSRTTVQAPPAPELEVKTITEAAPVVEIMTVDEEPANQDQEQVLLSYTVQSGDYLGKIAKRFGTEVQTLRDLNGIEGSFIEVGQQILYPRK